MTTPGFGWLQIIRLGLIQACLGAVVGGLHALCFDS